VLPDYEVTDLPLGGRNVIDLVGTMSGVQRGGRDNTFAIFAGNRSSGVTTTRDGVSVNDTRHNDVGAMAVTYTSPDLVEEVRVIASPADAELGRGTAQVQMATRAGTNQFRGSLFWTNRNSALDASNWFNNFSRIDKDYSNRNQFGGRLGGPIIKNKTFFFFLYDGHVSPRETLSSAMSSRHRRGKASSVISPECRAATRFRITRLSIWLAIR